MSQKFTLTDQDYQKSLKWALIFLAPLGVMYFGSVQAVLMTVGHTFHFTDFIPNQFVLGGGVLYIIERLYDISLRWAKGESPVKDQPVIPTIS